MGIAFIGVGANLGDTIDSVHTAIEALRAISRHSHHRASSLYRSPPVGPQDQPDYTNAVVQIDTDLAPAPLLSQLQSIEQQYGRVRTRRWGPRTLDLDLLLYDSIQQYHPDLTLPHPEMLHRHFVLLPMVEIAPFWYLPQGGTAAYFHALLPKDYQMDKLTTW